MSSKDCTENIDAQNVLGYVVENRDKHVEVMYPTEMTGRTFEHGRFVAALRGAASISKVEFVVGAAKRLIEDESGQICGVAYSTPHGDREIRASLTVIADGCFSRLRKQVLNAAPIVQSHFVAMEMSDCPQYKNQCAELIISDEHPILVYKISSVRTRILIDIKGNLPRDLRNYLKDNIYHQLPERLKPAFQDVVESGQLRVMPNSFLPPSPLHKRGVLCLGDAYNMRHPLTGGGMSVALCDVVMLRDLFRKIKSLNDAQELENAVKIWNRDRRRGHSLVVNVLSMALYRLFSADDEETRELKDACFHYFQLGGECTDGPMRLLSILNARPTLFVVHFFAVAVFSILRIFLGAEGFRVHRAVAKSARVFLRACSIVLPLLWSELKTVQYFW